MKFGCNMLNQSEKATSDYYIINIYQKIYNSRLFPIKKKRRVTFTIVKSKLAKDSLICQTITMVPILDHRELSSIYKQEICHSLQIQEVVSYKIFL